MTGELLRVLAGRLTSLVPVLVGITLLVWAMSAIALGDSARASMGQRADPAAVERVRRELELDRPAAVRYAHWVGRLVRGDLGRSLRDRRPVAAVIAERLPATVRLALAATVVSVMVGVPVGIVAATRRRSVLDHVLMAGAVLGISTPVFWLGMMLSLVFAVTLGLLPVSGYGGGDWRHLVLPALTLGALHTGVVARMTRASFLEVARQDYLQSARAKGLSELTVLMKHAFRNAAIPVVTVIGLGLADLLVGAPLTETVFAWPGLGRLLVVSVDQRDVPVAMGVVLVFAIVYVAGSLLVDLVYLGVDPRTRREPARQ
jgi:peptide/nickel transport system permease protein